MEKMSIFDASSSFYFSNYSNNKEQEGEESGPTIKLSWDKINWKTVNQKVQEMLCASSNPLYDWSPGVVDPKIPLKEHFSSIQKESDTITKGASGKIKLFTLNQDPYETVFAIKTAIPSIAEWFGAPTTPGESLRRYKRNMDVSLKMGDHPNFMKVFGIFVKERNVEILSFSEMKGEEGCYFESNKKKPLKAYMILEHIDGKTFRDLGQVSKQEAVQLLEQLKTALVILLEKGVLPVDINFGNFMVDVNGTLKFIDFDCWEFKAPNSLELANYLYAIAAEVAMKLISGQPEGILLDVPKLPIETPLVNSKLFEIELGRLIERLL